MQQRAPCGHIRHARPKASKFYLHVSRVDHSGADAHLGQHSLDELARAPIAVCCGDDVPPSRHQCQQHGCRRIHAGCCNPKYMQQSGTCSLKKICTLSLKWSRIAFKISGLRRRVEVTSAESFQSSDTLIGGNPSLILYEIVQVFGFDSTHSLLERLDATHLIPGSPQHPPVS
jgi:hypothetical protein